MGAGSLKRRMTSAFKIPGLLFARLMSSQRNQRIESHDFVERMSLPIWQAMAAVRWLEGRVRNRPKASEVTPEKAALTDADCVSQEILLIALKTYLPWVSLDVEEDTPSAASFVDNESDEKVVIDPIDGTLRYLLGDGPYAILVGLERAGKVEAALVGLPQADILIRAIRGRVVELARGGGPFTPAQLAEGGSDIFVSYGLPLTVGGRLKALGLELMTAAGGVIGVAPLLEGAEGGLRISRHDEGLSRRAWVAALPTLEAGGCVEALDGPFPPQYEPGVMGVLVARSDDALRRLRGTLG